MAIVVNTGTVECVGDTPSQVVGANADRVALLLDITSVTNVSFSTADATAYADGFVWHRSRGPLIDDVCQTGEVWAVLDSGKKRTNVTFMEWYDDGA